jgi:hypothetical protein
MMDNTSQSVKIQLLLFNVSKFCESLSPWKKKKLFVTMIDRLTEMTQMRPELE